MRHVTPLSVIGPCTFKLLRNLLTPDKPGDKSYTDLVNILTDHFSPRIPRLCNVQSFTAVHGRGESNQCLWQNCVQLLNIRYR